jgi:hypothetical protein
MGLGPGKTLLHGQTLRSGQRPLGGKTAQGSNDDDEEIMFEPSDQNLSHDEQAGKCGSRSHFMTLGPGKTLLHGQTFTENSSSSDDELVANLKGGSHQGEVIPSRSHLMMMMMMTNTAARGLYQPIQSIMMNFLKILSLMKD